MAKVGEAIAQARAAKRLTQQELAERAGTSQSAISQIEKGERAPSFATASQIADALGVSVADLLGVVPPGLAAEEITHFRNRKTLSEESRKALDSYLAFLLASEQKKV